MKKVFLIITMCFCTMTILTTKALADECGVDQAPRQWKDLEIEAKWQASNKTYKKLVKALKHGKQFEGYKLEVRWNKNSRRFVDTYYDVKNDKLNNLGHALRVRNLYVPKGKIGADTLKNLRRANWKKRWSRVQYKSTPKRVGAVWFRAEKGDCLVYSEDKNDSGLCQETKNQGLSAKDAVKGNWQEHPAIGAMLDDHPHLDFDKLKPFMKVRDYRYRVEFHQGGEAILEMSMDRLTTTFQDSNKKETNDIEIELEIIKPNYNKRDLKSLFKMVELFQNRFDLKPSTSSKGGNTIKNACR
ncbi:MAG: CYTH domain-containing protein [Bacteriovoracaceae bacterium]|nr:CYTH domain-containing protein [Bacteriovoracaceae bacterium]